jgi:hypothetical protein
MQCDPNCGVETNARDRPAVAVRGLKNAALPVLDDTGKLGLARQLYGERLAETRELSLWRGIRRWLKPTMHHRRRRFNHDCRPPR